METKDNECTHIKEPGYACIKCNASCYLHDCLKDVFRDAYYVISNMLIYDNPDDVLAKKRLKKFILEEIDDQVLIDFNVEFKHPDKGKFWISTSKHGPILRYQIEHEE